MKINTFIKHPPPALPHQNAETPVHLPNPLTFVSTYSSYTVHLKKLVNDLRPDIKILTGTDNIIFACRKNPNSASLLFCKSSFSQEKVGVNTNQKCGTRNCKACQLMKLPKQLLYNDLKIKLDFSLNCKSDNVIYVARCKHCQDDPQYYFGQTCNRLNVRLNGHRACFKTDNLSFEKSALSMHSYTDHVSLFTDKLDNYDFGIIKQVAPRNLDRAEDFYIFKSRADLVGLNRYKVCN